MILPLTFGMFFYYPWYWVIAAVVVLSILYTIIVRSKRLQVFNSEFKSLVEEFSLHHNVSLDEIIDLLKMKDTNTDEKDAPKDTATNEDDTDSEFVEQIRIMKNMVR